MSGGWSQAAGLTFAQDFGGLTGITVTPSNTINTKGSWISLGSLVSGCAAFNLKLIYQNLGQADYTSSVDIGIGPSGSQVVLVADVVLCNIAGVFQAAVFQHLIPVSLPPNTQIWARSAINKATPNASITCWLTPFDNSLPYIGECTGVDTIGTIGVGRGTVVTAGSNLSGVKGSYVTLNTTAGTAREYEGFFLVCDLAHNAGNEAGVLMDIAVGPSGSQKIIFPDALFYCGGVESPSDFEFMPVPVPKGSQIWARAAGLNATTYGVTFYGVF